MLRDASWPRFVAWASIVVAVVEEVVGVTLVHNHQVQRLVLLGGFAFLVYLGATFTRFADVGAKAQEIAPEAPVTVP
jgi:threonine/homoserine/homoserine lactone efflux protein